ncbi:MAG: RNA 3'-terminal phosphate cyclase [Candidatus Hadarchaeum sp.]|uniref:RNA 3'-terminal phosphate cyclase n=1 Tax=Candidatus Hadarchaeum sp. TaxID=2883567 RepID=UPI003D1155A1
MIEIDGSMGEGGGAVLRTALALGAVSGRPVHIFNIRARREKAGLQLQHLRGVEALAKICGAEVRGAALNSTELTFIPGQIQGGRYHVDIGTAGSTTLIMQIIMPAAAFANGPLEIEIKGGTDNPLAPPIDYLRNVTVPVLRRMGYRCEVSCIRRGHYPRGGGTIRAKIEPVEGLRAIKLVDQGRVLRVAGIAHAVRLPSQIATRIAHAASLELIRSVRAPVDIRCESYQSNQDPHLGPGAGITLWAETSTEAIIGTSSLGEPGKPSEKVGREAALDLIAQLRTGMACDRHLSDQLVPYLALAEGTSEITCTSLTSHTLTNIELVHKILGVKFGVSGEGGQPGKVTVAGIGFKKTDKS